jgi:hypothetical protein
MKKFIPFLIIILFLFISFNVAAKDYFADKKNEYQNKLEEYYSSRDDYLSLYNQYRSECLKEGKNCESLKQQTLQKAKSYFKYSINSAILYIELLKIRVEASSGSDEQKIEVLQKIDTMISSFKDKEKLIGGLNSSEKVKELSDSLKTLWINSEKQVISYRAVLYFWKAASSNKQLNDFASSVEDYMLELGEEYDIENLLSEYNETKITLLELDNKLKLINTEVAGITKEKYANLQKSLLDYKKTTLEITDRYRQIILKLKKNDFAKKSEKKLEILYIKGEGKIIVEGDFEISGDIGDKDILGQIEALSSDDIDTFGNGQAIKEGDKITYKDIGDFNIKSNNQVIVSSAYLDILIKGRGKVSVRGEGLYKLGSNGSWLEIPSDGLEKTI